MNLLVVCTGNVCRSPMMESVLLGQAKRSAAAANLTVVSRGVRAAIGWKVDPKAVVALEAAGYVVDSNRLAKPLMEWDWKAADVILVAEPDHKLFISRKAPVVASKIWLFKQWTGGGRLDDPIGKGQAKFNEVLKEVEEAAESWLSQLGKLG